MLKLEVVMLIAIFLLAFMVSLKAKNKNKDREKNQSNIFQEKTVSEEIFPFNSETNLEQFIDSMAGLLNCQILIKKSNISTTLNARPVLKTLFGKRSQRRYVIRINKRQNFKGVKLDEVPQDAKIGLWFHELMHIKDYQSRSFFGILKRGVQYLTMKGKRLFEHEIDRMVIQNGYGQYLYQWSYYSMNTTAASEQYKAFKSSVY